MVRGITCAVPGTEQYPAPGLKHSLGYPWTLRTAQLQSQFFWHKTGTVGWHKGDTSCRVLVTSGWSYGSLRVILWVHPQKLRVENVVHHRVALDMEQRGGLSSPSVIPTMSSPSSCFLNAYLEESSCCCAYWFATAGWFLMGIRLCSLWNSFVNLGVLLVAPVHFLYSPLQNLFPPVLNVHYP